jgi:hypothetical protein
MQGAFISCNNGFTINLNMDIHTHEGQGTQIQIEIPELMTTEPFTHQLE